MNIYFDCETESLPAEQLKALKPMFEPSKVLKDPVKIEADILAKEKEWLEKAALHAHTGKIIAIGYIAEDKVIIDHEVSESELIKIFWLKFQQSDLTSKFIGHNIKGFDVPFLVRRSFILGIKIPFGVIEGRYVGHRFADTMEAWAAGTRDMISLDTLSKALGVGAKTGEGKYFAETYKTNQKEALAYLENDLFLVSECAKKMNL